MWFLLCSIKICYCSCMWYYLCCCQRNKCVGHPELWWRQAEWDDSALCWCDRKHLEKHKNDIIINRFLFSPPHSPLLPPSLLLPPPLLPLSSHLATHWPPSSGGAAASPCWRVRGRRWWKTPPCDPGCCWPGPLRWDVPVLTQTHHRCEVEQLQVDESLWKHLIKSL